MKRMALLVPLFIFVFVSPLLAQNDVLTEIRDVGAYEVKSDGFILDTDQQISIHAVAASDRYRGVGTSVWILNKTSRDVVWRLKNARQHNRSHGLADYDDAVQLSKGEYEVYYAAYPEPSDGIENFGDFVDFLSGRIFNGNRHSSEYRDLTPDNQRAWPTRWTRGSRSVATGFEEERSPLSFRTLGQRLHAPGFCP